MILPARVNLIVANYQGRAMNWEAIGGQIRGNTKSTEAATAASYMQAYSSLNQRLSDLESARIIRLAQDDPDAMTADESMAYNLMLSGALPLYEVLFHMHSEGSMPAQFWRVVREDVVQLGSLAPGRQVLEGYLALYDRAYPAYAAEIRKCLSEEPAYAFAAGKVSARGP
jgi:hypothetical protein